jgi:hypothetical protein
MPGQPTGSSSTSSPASIASHVHARLCSLYNRATVAGVGVGRETVSLFKMPYRYQGWYIAYADYFDATMHVDIIGVWAALHLHWLVAIDTRE